MYKYKSNQKWLITGGRKIEEKNLSKLTDRAIKNALEKGIIVKISEKQIKDK